jgi:hypothetical protein
MLFHLVGMNNLVIPKLIIIQLKDKFGEPINCEKVLLYIKTNPRTLADFHLGPFYSNSRGLIQITKTDFLNEVEANYATGFLDFEDIESNHPEVEFRLYTQEEIEVYIKTRKTTYPLLLDGEDNRWKSIEELVTLLKKANNSLFDINLNNRTLIARLDGSKDNYELEHTLKPFD